MRARPPTARLRRFRGRSRRAATPGPGPIAGPPTPRAADARLVRARGGARHARARTGFVWEVGCGAAGVRRSTRRVRRDYRDAPEVAHSRFAVKTPSKNSACTATTASARARVAPCISRYPQ